AERRRLPGLDEAWRGFDGEAVVGGAERVAGDEIHGAARALAGPGFDDVGVHGADVARDWGARGARGARSALERRGFTGLCGVEGSPDVALIPERRDFSAGGVNLGGVQGNPGVLGARDARGDGCPGARGARG